MNYVVRRAIRLWIGVALLTGFLGGCVGSGAQGGNQTEKLTIVSYNNLIKEDFIESFEKMYPEVELDVTSYAGVNGTGYAQHSLENGDIPDIYVTSQKFNRQAQQKYLLDLSNYDFVNNYSTVLLDSVDIDGSIYLLPSGYTLTGIYYNKTILEENNWAVPQSFNELVELSEKIEAAGYRTMGHGMSLDGYPFNYFFNIGNTVYFDTPEGTQWKAQFPKGEADAAGNSGLREAAEYFDKWVEKGFINTENTKVDEFYEGDCIFFLCLGLSEYEHVTEDGKKYEFGTIPWLSEDGGNNMLTRNVSRYMGINKSLGEKGNEQKLEAALKLMHYISTAEGQHALMSDGSRYMPSLNGDTLPQDSPYLEISALVSEGRVVPLVYVGWESLIVPIAQDIKKLINRDIDVDGLLEAFDATNSGLLNGSSEDICAVASETLTMETTAKLVAIAEGKAVGADCAMISLNVYHGDDLCNSQGLGWYLYKGAVNSDKINMIRPKASTISVLKMSGAEIKAMKEAGFDYNGNGKPYEYLLFTRDDMELKDTVLYKLAISTGELTEDMLPYATETQESPAGAVRDYLKELGQVNTEVIFWK